jgi:two-component sensor histidine kinase
LTTNSVRHGAPPGDTELVFRVEVSNRMVRLEVQDAGHDGAIAQRPPGDGGGYGLNIVQTLSERWGFERVARGGTRVWAQIALEPLTTSLATA